MFASHFRDSGIKWAGVFSYCHMMKTATSFFAFLHLMFAINLKYSTSFEHNL